MTAQEPVRTMRFEDRTFADVLIGLRDHGPVTAFELAALIATMETLPQPEVRRAAVAVVVERLAAGLGRPDLEMRARQIRVDALQRESGDPSRGAAADERPRPDRAGRVLSGRYDEAEKTLRSVTGGADDHLVTEGDGPAERLLTLAEARRLRGD